ncbi:MAG: GFA family protein [Hyphomicrobiales bacterium]|nr:GFA family protein [Hyphomicrobiales bacterium]MCP5374009.1 GFA family protein [Hyphomicrobiales bacterium]
MAGEAHTGGCLCGAVRYRVTGPLRPVIACHCDQCRRTSGHFVAATAARLGDFALTEDRGLTWFRSSDWAQRGFCATCGSSLFYRGDGLDRVSIHAGTLDKPTGLRLAAHIFAGEHGDYYDIADGLPRHDDHRHGIDAW